MVFGRELEGIGQGSQNHRNMSISKGVELTEFLFAKIKYQGRSVAIFLVGRGFPDIAMANGLFSQRQACPVCPKQRLECSEKGSFVLF